MKDISGFIMIQAVLNRLGIRFLLPVFFLFVGLNTWMSGTTAEEATLANMPVLPATEVPTPEIVAPGTETPTTPSLLPANSTPDPSAQSSFLDWSSEETFAPTWYEPTYWFGPEPWDRSVELGINGAAGTNESLSIRAGGYLKRKTDRSKIDLQLLYNQTSSKGLQTQNNAQFDGRYDWLLGESPWTIFVATTVFYDEFQAFDLRFAGNSGIGFQFIDTERANLIGRFGFGTSREFGGPDDRWVPEGILGGEFNFQISDAQKFYAKSDYFPDWEDFSNYRLVSDIGWELLIDAESNLSLKVSAIDRYDSTPNGVDPHSLNYSILLLWKL